MLDRLDRVPPPQADALRVAFGVASDSAPDRFFVGLAVLNLLSYVAEEQPLICLINDEQDRSRIGAGLRLRCAPPRDGVGRIDPLGTGSEFGVGRIARPDRQGPT
jgi:hypothetical protein